MKGDQRLREIEERRLTFEEKLDSLTLPNHTPELYEPVRYVLEGEGKRIRPLLVLLTAEAFGGEEAFERTIPAAIAVEMFHAFTLVHDDIMDDANTRRGRETVHVKWDVPTAILTGDYLFGLAYEQLRRTRGVDLVAAGADFHATVAALCEGQALDMAFASRTDVSLDDYLGMIDRKTAALLAFCLLIGGRIGGPQDEARANLHRAGIALGRAFQIQDDLLDLTADSDSWGKMIGGDLVEGKRTFLLLNAIERANEVDQRFFTGILDAGLPEEEIGEARDRMRELGVLDDTAGAVAGYVDDAINLLKAVPESSGRSRLFALVERLSIRGH